MTLKLGNYDVCALDLVCDHQTGKLSTVKIWSHVANAIMSKVMLTQQSVSWDLMAAYGAIVGGSYVAMYFFKWKYRDAVPADSKKLGVE